MANTVEVSSNIWNWINTSVQVPDAVREKFEQWSAYETEGCISFCKDQLAWESHRRKRVRY